MTVRGDDSGLQGGGPMELYSPARIRSDVRVVADDSPSQVLGRGPLARLINGGAAPFPTCDNVTLYWRRRSARRAPSRASGRASVTELVLRPPVLAVITVDVPEVPRLPALDQRATPRAQHLASLDRRPPALPQLFVTGAVAALHGAGPGGAAGPLVGAPARCSVLGAAGPGAQRSTLQARSEAHGSPDLARAPGCENRTCREGPMGWGHG